MWRPGLEPQSSLSPQPASPYLYPGLRIPGLTPRILLGVKAMLPLRNRNKCPESTPPLSPQGVEYAKGVLLGTPIQSIAVPMGVVGLV